MRRLLALGVLAGLAGCSAVGTNPSLSNPDTFTASVAKDTGVISGAYNESGFSRSQVETLLDALCVDGDISGYSETREQLLVGFQAACSADIHVDFNVITFTRTAPGKAKIDVRGSETPGLYSTRTILTDL